VVRQYNASQIKIGDFTIVIDYVCGGRLAKNGIRPLTAQEMETAYKSVPEATQFIDMPTNHLLKQHFAKLDAIAAQQRKDADKNNSEEDNSQQ